MIEAGYFGLCNELKQIGFKPRTLSTIMIMRMFEGGSSKLFFNEEYKLALLYEVKNWLFKEYKIAISIYAIENSNNSIFAYKGFILFIGRRLTRTIEHQSEEDALYESINYAIAKRNDQF